MSPRRRSPSRRRTPLHSRRQAIALLRNKDITYRLFDVIGPAFSDVQGGYTRVLKLGPRQGDAAPMVLLELSKDVEAATARCGMAKILRLDLEYDGAGFSGWASQPGLRTVARRSSAFC